MNDEFILSDRSLPENYMNCKREKLKRIRNEPLEFDNSELPVSEPIQACAGLYFKTLHN